MLRGSTKSWLPTCRRSWWQVSGARGAAGQRTTSGMRLAWRRGCASERSRRGSTRGSESSDDLGELSRAYGMVVSDGVRVQNRIKSLYRSRGIPTGHKEVYAPAARAAWLPKLPVHVQALAAILYEELDAVRALQKRSVKELLTEARQHRIFHVLRTCPGLGTIRTSQLLPIVVTPYRLASKRGFWAYAGMAIVMRS